MLFDSLNNTTDNFEVNNNIKMYVISLKHKNRLDNIKEQQSKINTNIEIFDAVNGDKLNINQLISDKLVLVVYPNIVNHLYTIPSNIRDMTLETFSRRTSHNRTKH